jgi:hypothetical protein
MRLRIEILSALAVLALLAGCGGGGKSSLVAGGAGTTPATTSSQPLSLPATLGGYQDVVAALTAKGAKPPAIQAQTTHQATVKAATESAYTQAFGGAPSAYHAYSDGDLQAMPWLIAVRAQAPGLVIGPVQDIKYLQLGAPQRQVQTFGAVQCVIERKDVTPAGKTPDPDQQAATSCQRTGPGLTVFTGGIGFDGAAGVQRLVGFTNAAWSAAGGM